MKEGGTYYLARDREGLTVFIMGSIMLEYNRKPLQVPGGPSGKILQLVLILLHSGKKGVHRGELLDTLYRNSECSNPSGSLRATVFRLRKPSEGNELPPREYIRTDRRIYRWDGRELPVYIDARDLENTVKMALHSHDEAFLKRTCSLYQGEFLVQLAGEKWVSVVGVRYQKLCFNCLRVTNSLMKKNRECSGLLEIYNYACELYPYEECQIMKTDCLVAMKRFKEVVQVYGTAVSQYFEEQGLPPPEKMPGRFRIMSGQIRYTFGTLKDIRDSLHEGNRINRPYYCAYPASIDCYRLLTRTTEWVGFSGVLSCCALLDSKGKPLGTGGRLLKTTSGKPHDAIGKFLGKGDLFACYNPSQYLVILNGISNEYCLWTYEWIDRDLHLQDGGREVKLNYQVMPESLIQRNEEKFIREAYYRMFTEKDYNRRVKPVLSTSSQK